MTAAAVAFGGGTLAATMAGTSSAAVLATTTQQDQAAAGAAGSGDYVVLYERGASKAAAKRAIERAGGRITRANGKVGYALVKASDPQFAARVEASDAIVGAARNRIIGRAPQPLRPDGVTMKDDVERLSSERAALKGSGGRGDAKSAQEPLAEPLANLQWDMRQIGATPQGSYAESQGKRRVKVGIIDTGVDGHHPDIAPNFSRRLSANFTVDIPFVDGECEEADCVDPPDVDDNGHGTHVASTVGSPINGLGMAGVAPKVKLINIRAGQDSGYFFLAPTLLALTYAGDIGVDVVNMSYYVDPWLFNCVDNPADSPAERTEQRVIRQTVQRAVSYAMNHGVMPIAAEGNGATDLGNPEIDATSPDFPP
ncbi:MAG: S8 family serine peptidase, partial [Actinomycetota bacterium]|nr:S8 family serine peptidase [Actinomycetota bacterium]